MNQSIFSGLGEYEIKIGGHLDETQGYWFEGLTITTDFDENGEPITTFTGPITDQTALHGMLARIRDMNLPLISVIKI